jgi:four helix bundle suffix protein
MNKDGKNAKNGNDGKYGSPASPPSHPLLTPRGDYHTLLSFQKAEVVYQTNYLLDQQLHRLEKDFVEQGGLRERMTRVRLQYRNEHQQP